jgi:TolB-like protein/tetratricopeptide (TPR) repeat protein
MALLDPQASANTPEPKSAERLDSWKEIAAYLKRDESTVRRWEEEGLPVHRHPHKKKASIFAYRSEIDRWSNNGHGTPAATTAAVAPAKRRSAFWWTAAALVLLVLAAFGANVLRIRNRLPASSVTGHITSIAVLPLRNVSDPAQDYFADGMTEALTTQLGQISALTVISHQTMLGYKGTTKTVPEIARELNVEAILGGATLQSGDRVRITTNLSQAVPEHQIWAKSYERDRRDVLGVQAEVAREVANRIQVQVTPQEQARLASARTVDPDALQNYLLGREYALQTTAFGWTHAKEYFETAIAKDPGYAPAYAAQAELHSLLRGAPTRKPSELRRQARYWAQTALSMDETLAEAHIALARVSAQERDWASAESEYRRAIELNASNARAHIWYALYLYAMGRFEESLSQAALGQRLDPASAWANTWAGAAYLVCGRAQEGMELLRRALELEPRSTDASVFLARTHVKNGAYQRAIKELQQVINVKKEREPLVLGALAHSYARAGLREEALELVAELKKIDRDVKGYVPPFGLIWAYAGLGDRDRAFDVLDRAYELGSDRMTWLNVDPLLDPLRSDPRFIDLVRRMGFPSRDAQTR